MKMKRNKGSNFCGTAKRPLCRFPCLRFVFVFILIYIKCASQDKTTQKDGKDKNYEIRETFCPGTYIEETTVLGMVGVKAQDGSRCTNFNSTT